MESGWMNGFASERKSHWYSPLQEDAWYMSTPCGLLATGGRVTPSDKPHCKACERELAKRKAKEREKG